MSAYSAPLTEPVLQLLQHQLENIILSVAGTANDKRIEEHYLLSRLGLKLQSAQTVSDDLQRFQKHFVLYHLLYRIQSGWLSARRYYLHIGLANIQLLPFSAAPEHSENSDRRDYYQNWSHYFLMTEQLLDQHLQQFWQQYVSPRRTIPALSHSDARILLELPSQFTLVQLKKAYRTKALQLHPDRGGDAQHFVLLQQAYTQLLLLF